jgi:hypothetical protein
MGSEEGQGSAAWGGTRAAGLRALVGGVRDWEGDMQGEVKELWR